jgi:arylsulfatase A-like enzyme
MYVGRVLLLITAISLAIGGCGGGGGSGGPSSSGSSSNTAPLADAGPDQSVTTGAVVMMDGSGSSDADGDALSYTWTLMAPAGSASVLSGDTTASPSFTADVDGDYVMSLVVSDGTVNSVADSVTITASAPAGNPFVSRSYAIVDTGQTQCFDSSTGAVIACTGIGYDADYAGNQPNYSLNGDGLTVTDNVTGLIWQQSSDVNGDGEVDYADKLLQGDAVSYCDGLVIGGRSDWRLPSVKEAYSLIMFDGTDASGYQGTDTSALTPFLDPVFDWAFGDVDHPQSTDRIIDAQYASTTIYRSTTMVNNATMFGVNTVDGRIKGYPLNTKLFYVRCVTGNADYGVNNFVDNGDQTVSDNATGLMWQRNDSEPANWDQAVAQCETDTTGGHDDWRLPNAKELHSLVDYTRSPDTDGTAAIDPVFNATSFRNEGGWLDWGSYWSSTTHVEFSGGGTNAVNISFGESLGYMNGSVLDVHGAGAQRSDDKLDVSAEPGANSADVGFGLFYYKGPQGDILRDNNKVRCVRDIPSLPVATDGSKNILLIVGDDIGIDNVSAYGAQPNYTAQTPTIDSLATNGVLFRNAWANALCSPTRASLLTGRYAFRHGVTHPGGRTGTLADSEETIAEALSAAGYATALFGKWHLGANPGAYPTDQGFDYYSGGLGGGVDDYFNWIKTQIDGQGGTPSVSTETNYATQVVAREALAWISSSIGPWFVQVSFNAPHSPFHVPPDGTYTSVTLSGAVGDACAGAPARSCYRAAAEAMDFHIDNLLNGIDPDTLADTVIIFLGDNGTPGNMIIEESGLPFDQAHGKGTLYEGGINVPMVVYGGANTGVDTGEVRDLVLVQDLFSTVLEIANATPSASQVDGQSIIGYFDADTPEPDTRSMLYSDLYNDSEGIDRWAVRGPAAKYITRNEDVDGDDVAEFVEECYDLEIDAAESDEQYAVSGPATAECDMLRDNRPL